MFKGYYILLILFCLTNGDTYGQDSILVFHTLDSVKVLPNDTSKVKWLIERGKAMSRYFDQHKTENPFFQEAIVTAQHLRYYPGLFSVYNELGISRRNKSEYILA